MAYRLSLSVSTVPQSNLIALSSLRDQKSIGLSPNHLVLRLRLYDFNVVALFSLSRIHFCVVFGSLILKLYPALRLTS